MGKFKQLNQNLNNVISEIVNSQDLCKLIHYNNTDDPLNQPDINPTSLLFNNIFPFPKIPTIDEEAKSYLCILFDDFNTDSRSPKIKEGMLTFLIILHNDLWKIKGGLRPFSIMHEIDELFIGERVIGIKDMQFYRGRYVSFNNQFSGYEIKYRFVGVN